MEVVGVRCGHNCKLGHHQICPEFSASVRAKRTRINDARDGWSTDELPLREMTWRARYFGLPRGCVDHTGEAYTIERCPFCGGTVPEIVGSFANQCDGSEGEE